MRLQLILLRVKPTVMTLPGTCSYEDCQSTHFRHHQVVTKRLQDSVYLHVVARRYPCLRCGRSFRVYPMGVSEVQTSQRVQGLAVILYL